MLRMRGTSLRIGAQIRGTALAIFNTLDGQSSTHERRLRNCGRKADVCADFFEIGRLTVNAPGRPFTKWNRACDDRFARLIGCLPMHFGSWTSFIILVTAHAILICSKTPILTDSQNRQFLECCVYLVITACKKQTAVSHSSSEADVISLDIGLRTERSVASTLWDM